MFDLSVYAVLKTSYFDKRYAYKANAIPKEAIENIVNFEI